MPAARFGLIFAACVVSAPAIAQFKPSEESLEGFYKCAIYSPYAQRAFPSSVFWGDTHVHTNISLDAGMFNTLGPDEAYRFAKGEQVTSSTGLPVKLGRPLDWLVVANHSDMMGFATDFVAGAPVITRTEQGKRWFELFSQGGEGATTATLDLIGNFAQGTLDPALVEAYAPGGTAYAGAWQRIIDAAEAHDEPGRFTAFIGYEWSSGPGGNNLHRNVIFRNGKNQADQVVPFSAFDSEDPEDLWDWMERYETETGGKVLAIPHNGNLSNGLMFDDVTMAGEPLSADYAMRRMRWEPVYEVTQMKGDGEAHPMLSPDDAFADYETWDVGSFGAERKTPEMLPREYAREALKRGLAYDAELGANPFRFGMVGSTDSHTGLATTTEDNFFGKVSITEPTADPIRFEELITGRATPDDPSDDITHAQVLASGLAAVWSKENTREAIWDALARKEVYATTGTRLRVRVFAGTSFSEDDLARSDFAAYGYANGVPMGGDLTGLGSDDKPGLLIRALRDPDGANLDRVQVVKGWIDAEGLTQERVYDVACADGRKIVEGASDGAVGNTVDVASASYTNAIGDPLLETYWQDPDFDPSQRALYYVRVLEIPTPRWTTYDAAFFGVDLPDSVPPTHQERAYTSPIWYAPKG
jgi:hypothetical protein